MTRNYEVQEAQVLTSFAEATCPLLTLQIGGRRLHAFLRHCTQSGKAGTVESRSHVHFARKLLLGQPMGLGRNAAIIDLTVL